MSDSVADKDAVEDKIKQIIVEQLGVEKGSITPESRLVDDLGADSLDIVELVMAMEESFGIDIPDEEAEHLGTFGDAVKFVKERQAL